MGDNTGSKKNEEIKVLNDLLNATKDDDPKEYNFNKIMSLIEKSKQMKKEEHMRAQRTNQYFQQLKAKLAESTAYLQKARKDLDNTAAATSRKSFELNSVEDYEALMKKSDDEIQDDMNQMRIQLDMLHTRVKKFNEKSQIVDEFYAKSMQTLETINQGLKSESGDQ